MSKKTKKTAAPTCRTPAEITAAIKAAMSSALDSFHAALDGVAELARVTGECAEKNQVKQAPATSRTKTAKTAKTAKITKREADAAKLNVTIPEKTDAKPLPAHRTPASVRLTPHEITLNIGSQPVRELAENDAKDFLNNPRVFWYRNTQFPDPKRYGVQPRVEQVKVVKRADPKFTRAPWTVSVTIHVDGDDKKADSWGVGVLARNKGDQE